MTQAGRGEGEPEAGPDEMSRTRHPIVSLIFGLLCGVGALYGAAFVLFAIITGAGPVMPDLHPEDGAPYYGVLAVVAALPLLTFVAIAYQTGKRLGRLGVLAFALGAVGPMALGAASNGIDASTATGLAGGVALASVSYLVGAHRSSVRTRR